MGLVAREEFRLDPDTGINLPEGFDAELLYTVPESQGSWVAMAFDPKGRLIVSDQDSQGVFRVTLADERKPESKVRVESLGGFPYDPIDWGKRRVGGALGFLYAFDSLYMSSMKGLYRIRDTDSDDTYDEFTLLKKLTVGYEHSAHSIIESEDGKSLYLVSGNYNPVPAGATSLQPPVWSLDSLISPLPDPSGHAVSIKPPGGWICRFSPDGKDWTLVASGFRNPVDLAINREGELFTFDSDLEFDIGSPWYRPTRVNHVTSGSEFGWRTGSAKWPEYFADSMGAVVNVGPGSPTGISFGHHSNFPPEYQDKLFVCDWTFGTIYTIDMEEDGASYTGTKKEFLNGTPLNISAMRFGPDGAMYFLVGGRNTDSKLYRVRYTGPARTGAVKTLIANRELRELRRSLEAYHGSNEGGVDAIAKAWPNLAHDDRSIRYAARIVIENQDLELWQTRVFEESEARSKIYGAIALARHGDKALGGRLSELLVGISFDDLKKSDRLALLRAYSICLTRMDPPSADRVRKIIKQLDSCYPSNDDETNAELCRILSYLETPSVAAKTVALMKVTETEAIAYDKEMLARHEYGKAILDSMAEAPNRQNIHYAYSLRGVQNGWSTEDREYYFRWLNETLKHSGGRSFAGYIRAIRNDAINRLSLEETAALAPLLVEISTVDLAKLPSPKGPPLAWTTESAMEALEGNLESRNYENGKLMFSAGRCIACHRFQGTGGVSGPDLGSVANRYSVRDIIMAISEPSHSISEQYQASLVTLKDGNALYGRLIYENDEEVAVATNPYDMGIVQKAPVDAVEKIELSQISLMPPGTIAAMNQEELTDLIAYLVSGGDKHHAVFRGR